MDDINEARQRVLKHEQYRPDSRSPSAFLDRQMGWQHAFEQLIDIENKHDDRFRSYIAALPLGSDAAPKQLTAWASEVSQRIPWYAETVKRLRANQRSWGKDPKNQSLAPLAQVRSRHAACVSLAALINMELLEYQRRLNRRLNERTWQQAHEALEKAFHNQDSVWRESYKADLPSRIVHQRIVACQHLRTMQAATQGEWQGRSKFKVDGEGLNRDATTLDRTLAALRQPKPTPQSEGDWGCGVLIVAVIVVAILIAFNSWNAGSTPEPNTIAVPVRATPAVPSGAAPTASTGAVPIVPIEVSAAAKNFDDQGLALLRDGRYDEAIQMFQQAAAAAPSWYQPLNDMAFCMYERNEVYAAIASWQDALALVQQNSPDANAGLGMALYVSGTHDQGLAYYQLAIKQDARYRDKDWMRRERQWSDKAIADSQALRDQLGQ